MSPFVELRTPLLDDGGVGSNGVKVEGNEEEISSDTLSSCSSAGPRCIECNTPASEHHGNCHTCLTRTEGGGGTVCRSKLRVDGICCASEVPAIRAIVEPLGGVRRVAVYPSSRTVIVDHDPDAASARHIAEALTKQGFPSEVKVDGADAREAQQPVGIPTDVMVESTFDVSSVDGTEGRIDACLSDKFPWKHAKRHNIVHELRDGSKETLLVVKHNPYHVTANGILDVLRERLDESVVMVEDGGRDGMWAMVGEEVQEVEPRSAIPVRWNVALAGVLWVVSMVSYGGGQLENLKYVAIASVALALPPIALKAFKMLCQMHFDVNCMVLTAAAGALALQDYTESAGVAFLFSIGETLEYVASARARDALSSVTALRPERANVINPVTGEGVVLPASSVAVGTLVSVRPGDVIPCDGMVKEGRSTVDELRITGQSRPEPKGPGGHVSGGAVNAGRETLLVETTATSSNSAVARRGHLVEEAQATAGSDTEKLIDSFAKIYTPSVAFLGICMCTVPWAFGSEVGKYWFKNGLVTIAIACPCPVVISTPCTYMAALAAAAQRGVLVKEGKYLEELGRVKSIAFDKTGTLSKGLFGLLHFTVVGQTRTRKEVLAYLALMEKPASHPLSNAIVKAAADEQVELPKLQPQNHTLLPGEGITANIAGKDVHVGNRRLFQRLGHYDRLPQNVKSTVEEKWERAGGTVGYISIEGEGIVGAYCVVDEIRREAKGAVDTLKSMGIKITMITGDGRPSAAGIGEQLGLEECDVKSDLLPEEKMAEVANMVKENERRRKEACWGRKRAVMMVGDGVNDAPALSAADVSVAMGEGAAMAMDAANITLMDSDLHKLPFIINAGRRVVNTIVQNVVFSLAVKAIVLGFAIAGRASLWVAVGTDAGSMLAVTLNGTRLLSSPREEGRAESCSEEDSVGARTSASEMSTEMSVHSWV